MKTLEEWRHCIDNVYYPGVVGESNPYSVIDQEILAIVKEIQIDAMKAVYTRIINAMNIWHGKENIEPSNDSEWTLKALLDTVQAAAVSDGIEL